MDMQQCNKRFVCVSVCARVWGGGFTICIKSPG